MGLRQQQLGVRLGPQDDEESIAAAIHKALDLGVNWIDTAAIYGLGHSEEIVARALKGVANRPHIFTMCLMVWNERREIGHSLKAALLRHEVETSLRRLPTDVIELHQIHWPDADADSDADPDPDPEIEEGWSMLGRLKEEGKVRHIGVSNFSVEQMRRATAIIPVETLQPP